MIHLIGQSHRDLNSVSNVIHPSNDWLILNSSFIHIIARKKKESDDSKKEIYKGVEEWGVYQGLKEREQFKEQNR